MDLEPIHDTPANNIAAGSNLSHKVSFADVLFILDRCLIYSFGSSARPR